MKSYTSAGVCRLDPTNNRPIAGTVEFNQKYLSCVDINNESEQSWYMWISFSPTIHEILLITLNQDLTKQLKCMVAQIGLFYLKVGNMLRNILAVQIYQLENNGNYQNSKQMWWNQSLGKNYEGMTGSNFPKGVSWGRAPDESKQLSQMKLDFKHFQQTVSRLLVGDQSYICTTREQTIQMEQVYKNNVDSYQTQKALPY